MTPIARFTPQAKQDLLDIWDYIADDSVRSADRVLDTLTATAERLAATPLAGRARPELARNLRSYPQGNHVLFYRPADWGVEIIRILHGARDLPELFEGDAT